MSSTVLHPAEAVLERLAHGQDFCTTLGCELHEPVARHGPFVMSTREDLVQAFQDYQGNVYQVVRPPPWRMR